MKKQIILNLQTDFTIKSVPPSIGVRSNLKINGYASVFDIVDSQKDIISKNAFSTNIDYSKIRFLWQHDRTKPIGCVTGAINDSYGLKIDAEINAGCTIGREAIALIRQGAVKGLSVGFNIGSFFHNDEGTRVIEKANLVEISIVTFPANQHAVIESFKTGKTERVYGNNSENKLAYLTKKLIDIESTISKIKHKGGM